MTVASYINTKPAATVAVATSLRPSERAPWALLAAQRVAKSSEPADKARDAEDRVTRLRTRLADLEARAKALDADANPGPAKRDIRNACRYLEVLYADESGEAYEGLRKRAKQLLDSTPK